MGFRRISIHDVQIPVRLFQQPANLGSGVYGCGLNNCTLTGNIGWGGGGGAANCTLNNCTLTGNIGYAMPDSMGGGATYSTLNNCTLTGNSADNGYGGGAYECTLNNCTLTGNSAAYQGGGVRGGELNNCTLTGNSALGGSSGPGYGGGAFYAKLTNCIVYDNAVINSPNFDALSILNYCCTTPMPANGVGNITDQPGFVDLAGGNLRLQGNSPCINAGNNSYAGGEIDLDGNPRIVMGTVDIGAYEFQLPIVGSPSIVFEPESRTNNAGSLASFHVYAGGSEALGYQWRKDETPLMNGDKFAGATTRMLYLSNVFKADEGEYRVVITNSEGSVTSVVATLTVIDPVITVHPASQEKNPGENVTFIVTAFGTPSLSYQWRHDGVPRAGATTNSLTLTNLQASDAGSWDIVVSNSVGSVTSAVATLTLNLAQPDTFNRLLKKSSSSNKSCENPNDFGGRFFKTCLFQQPVNPGANGLVCSLALQPEEKILVGGQFTTLGGQSRTNFGRLNAQGVPDANFNRGAGGLVYTLAAQTDGKTLVGGTFTTLGGQNRSRLGRLNFDGTLDAGFDPGANGTVYSLAVAPDEKIVVAGNFTTLAGQNCTNIGRLSASGTLDTSFNAKAGSYVFCLAMQPDGKILVGGHFTNLCGQSRSYLGRLNSDGTLDTNFNAQASNDVYCFAMQADGRILVGGKFTNLCGQACNYVGRLNTNGAFDGSFESEANGAVNSLAVQTDGKILAGGNFTQLNQQTRNHIGRFNADGTLDVTFDTGTSGLLYALALQADAKLLVGGVFTNCCGHSRTNIARLDITEPATQNLACNGSAVSWLRGGTSPEVWRTSFDSSTNGTDWVNLGAGTRISGGWQLTGLALPTNATVRARGFVTGALYNGSSWFVESTAQVAPQVTPPVILVDDGSMGYRSNRFEFNIAGGSGQVVVVESSTNLVNWTPLATNTLGADPCYFCDTGCTNSLWRFYRLVLME